MKSQIVTDANGFIISQQPLFSFFDLVFGGRLDQQQELDLQHVNVVPWKLDNQRKHIVSQIPELSKINKGVELKPLSSLDLNHKLINIDKSKSLAKTYRINQNAKSTRKQNKHQ